MVRKTSLNRLYESVLSFYNHFYLTKKAITPSLAQTALKICGELGELAETINKSWSKQKQEDEFADVLITVFMHGINAGYSLEELIERAIQKLENRKKCCQVVNGIIVKNLDIQEKV